LYNVWDQFNFYIQNKKPIIETWADAVGYGDKSISSKTPTREEKKKIFESLLVSGALGYL
jgi:hypothetical protein